MHRLLKNRKYFSTYLLFLGAIFPALSLLAYSGYHMGKNHQSVAIPSDSGTTPFDIKSVSSSPVAFLNDEITPPAMPSAVDGPGVLAEDFRNFSAGSLQELYGDTGYRVTPIQRRTLPKESGLYRHPNLSEKHTLLRVVSMLYRGLKSSQDEAQASSLAQSQGYELVRLQTSSGQSYIVLQPQGFASGYFDNNAGFGIYLFNPQGNKEVVLEAPHPRFDRRSTDLALVAMEKIPAFALLIAGADRRANLSSASLSHKGEHASDFTGDISDVSFARNTDSLFHQVHETLTTLIIQDGRRPFVYQFHSYGERNDGNKWPDFVLSNGAMTHSHEIPELALLKKELGEKGYSTGICTIEQPFLHELSASHNPQGLQTRLIGGAFIHIEASYKVRKESNIEKTALHLAEALSLIEKQKGSQ